MPLLLATFSPRKKPAAKNQKRPAAARVKKPSTEPVLPTLALFYFEGMGAWAWYHVGSTYVALGRCT